MSENLSKEDQLNALKLLFSGFLCEVIGGATTYLIVLLVGLVDPFLAALLIIIVIAGATLGTGIVMIYLGNPYNIYWQRAKGVYEDSKDGSVDAEDTTPK